MQQLFLNLQLFFWIIAIGFGCVRYLIAVTTPTNYFKSNILSEDQKLEFRNGKNHNMVLASFTIIAISISISLTDIRTNDLEKIGLYFFFFALFCFFISSVLFHSRFTVWLPFTGDIIEKVGIITVVTGFLYLMMGHFEDDPFLGTLALLFIAGISVIVAADTYINWIAFHPLNGRNDK